MQALTSICTPRLPIVAPEALEQRNPEQKRMHVGKD